MRKLLPAVIALAAATTARAALVTYTLSLNESPTGAFQLNSYAVYATVSQGDNFGLFGYGVDMKLPSEGGPTTLTITQRSPFGQWVIDDADPNWDPDGSYPNKVAGFGLFRGTSPSGAVAGNQDISQYDPARGEGSLPCGSELMIVRGIGQTARNLTTLTPGKAMGLDGTCSVGWKPYSRLGSPASDNPYGTPFNPPLFLPLAAGSVRLFTGTWTGSTLPQIEPTVDTKAGVWRTNATTGPEAIQVDVAQVAIGVRNAIIDGGRFTLDATATSGSNQAVGGNIAVTGSNGKYVSEVDQLLNNAATGNAPIATIDAADGGSIYVMAKLTGTQAQIDSFLNDAAVTADVGAADSQFALLHANYDAAFGAGGFNALFKFPNAAGVRTINWDAGTTGVTIDALAAVPEPGMMLWVGFIGINLLPRRRRTK